MKKTSCAIALSLFASIGTAQAQGIEIRPNASAATSIPSKDYFIGHVTVDSLYPATDVTRASTGVVTFAPSARTAWHTHPAGQLLIVTAGKGWVQEDGQPRREINPGDVVMIPANVKHWHGATDKNGMSHIAVSYMQDGKNVTWMEQVSDAQYAEK